MTPLPELDKPVDYEHLVGLNSSKNKPFNETPDLEPVIPDYYSERSIQTGTEEVDPDTPLTPNAKSGRSPEWLTATFRPIWRDISENDHKIRTSLIGVGVIGTQVASKMRFSVVAVPKTGSFVLEHTHNAALTAVASGGVNFIISGAVGEFATQALQKYPRSVNTFSRKFPRTVEFFQKGLPGMDTPEVRQEKKDESISAKKILRGSSMHIRRALSGMGVDPGTFVATGYTMGYSEKEMREVNIGVGVDASLLVGAAGWGLAEYVNGLVTKGEYEKVETIQSWIGNTKNWWAVAGILMLSGYTSKKLATHKEKKKLAEPVPPEPTLLPESISNEITKPRAWVAVGALAIMANTPPKKHTTKTMNLADAFIRDGVSWLNKRKSLNIPK